VNIEYMAPAFLDDAIRVVSTPKDLRAASMSLDQDIYRDDTLLARAHVVVACLDGEGRLRRVPKDVRKKLEPLKA